MHSQPWAGKHEAKLFSGGCLAPVLHERRTQRSQELDSGTADLHI